MTYTEANYANAMILLIKQLGYTYYYGPEVERDCRQTAFRGGFVFSFFLFSTINERFILR